MRLPPLFWMLLYMLFASAGLFVITSEIFAAVWMLGAVFLILGSIIWRLWRQSASQAGEVEKLNRLQKLLDRSEIVILSAGNNGEITEYNRPAATTFEIDLQRSNLSDIFGKPLVPKDGQQEQSYRTRDGKERTCTMEFGHLKDAEERIVGTFLVGLDTTERRINEQELREKQEFIQSLAKHSPTLFFTFDLERSEFVYANRSLLLYLGYSADQAGAMGADYLPSIIHPEDLDVLFNRLQYCRTMKDGEVYEAEMRCVDAQGNIRWLQSRDVVFKRDESGRPRQILVNLMDVTDRRVLDEQVELQLLEIQDTNLALEIQTSALEEANTRLEGLAYCDGLTGIRNHRSFQETLAKEFERAHEFGTHLSVILIDVDHFKLYNDTYGHPSGDIVLKKIASTFVNCCDEGSIAARYGGEEFAIICPDKDPHQVRELAEKIRAAVESTPWPERCVTVSIGFATMKKDATMPSQLVSQADAALYVSKAQGRNRATDYADARSFQLAS